jgi:hypothetical protein
MMYIGVKTFGGLLLLALSGNLLCETKTASSRIITIDWTKPDGGLGAPPTVDKPTDFSIIVANVNDILYEYEVNVAVTTAPTEDFANLLSLLSKPVSGLAGGGVAVAIAGCSDADLANFQKRFDDLVSAIKGAAALNPKFDGTSYESIPVVQTGTAWNSIKPLPTLTTLDADIGSSKCKPALGTLINNVSSLLVPVTTINKRATASTHSSKPVTVHVGPGQQLKVTVNEYYTPLLAAAPNPNGKAGDGTSSVSRAVTTSNGKVFTITPSSNVLTLSAGFMASTIGARTYVARPIPGQTQSILVVDNNSKWRPAGVALLNYQIPYLEFGDLSFALSAGPVVTFGSGGANVSSLGFFGGISGSLYHRLYITPGIQLGQFSDFPAGFENGTPIPANFGTPIALNRWTARFAIGITFQTLSFAKLAGQTTVAPVAAGQTKNPSASGQ